MSHKQKVQNELKDIEINVSCRKAATGRKQNLKVQKSFPRVKDVRGPERRVSCLGKRELGRKIDRNIHPYIGFDVQAKWIRGM